jgi:hypothetical protein
MIRGGSISPFLASRPQLITDALQRLSRGNEQPNNAAKFGS